MISEQDLACKCGCGTVDLDKRLLPALEELERRAGEPIRIVEAYRCPAFIERRGPSKLAHLQGRAADISIPGRTIGDVYLLALEVEDFFNGGIGVNDDGTIHVDVRVLPARWGRVEGKYVGLETSGLLEKQSRGTETYQ